SGGVGNHGCDARRHCPSMMRTATLHAGLEPYPGYRLRRLLGRVGFAEVWEADAPAGQRVALKFMPCSDQSPGREIHSLQALRSLKHPNIIVVHQVWCYDFYIVVAMELAEGSLLDFLEAYQTEYRTPISATQVCEYLLPVAGALDFLNAR